MNDFITIRDAREGGLKGVDIDIPLGQLNCFSGRAGSGARALAVEVMCRESRRRYLQALAVFERKTHRNLQAADVDEIYGLPPAIRIPGNPGARILADQICFTEVMALLFERHGTNYCSRCGGLCLGFTAENAASYAVDILSGSQVMVVAPVCLSENIAASSVLAEMEKAGYGRFLIDGKVVRSEELTEKALSGMNTIRVIVDRLQVEPKAKIRLVEDFRTARSMAAGRSLLTFDDGTLPLNHQLTCSSCCQEFHPMPSSAQFFEDVTKKAYEEQTEMSAVQVVLAGRSPREVASMRIAEAASWLAEIRESIPSIEGDALASGAIEEIYRVLTTLQGIGLGSSSLRYSVKDLSSGEWLRLSLALSVSRSLAGILYVVEPVSGLDPANKDLAIVALQGLVAMGNTVVLLDNDPSVQMKSDENFSFADGVLAASSTPKPKKPSIRKRRHSDKLGPGSIKISILGNSEQNNLRNLELEIPLSSLVVVTGTSGAGATKFVREVVAPTVRSSIKTVRSRASAADAIGYSVSSVHLGRLIDLTTVMETALDESLVETLGLMGPIGSVFAKQPAAQALGLKSQWFQLNRPGGRCSVCAGKGVLHLDIGFLDEIAAPCTECEGRRYGLKALEITHRGRSPADVLDMTVDVASQVYGRESRVAPCLMAVAEHGMGGYYLGQLTGDLEYMERLRIQLAAEISRASKKDLFLLDEPLIGAHPVEAVELSALLTELVCKGSTVIVTSRSEALLECADRIVEFGPGSGPEGGRVIVYR